MHAHTQNDERIFSVWQQSRTYHDIEIIQQTSRWLCSIAQLYSTTYTTTLHTLFQVWGKMRIAQACTPSPYLPLFHTPFVSLPFRQPHISRHWYIFLECIINS